MELSVKFESAREGETQPGRTIEVRSFHESGEHVEDFFWLIPPGGNPLLISVEDLQEAIRRVTE